MHAPYRGHRIVPGVMAPPLDAFTQPAGAYSFRKLRSAYAGPAIRIRRASDNAELDINFLGFVPGLGSPWDVAAATAHCAATSCFVVTMYDQSGNSRDITQATPANQPALVFNCVNGLACFQNTANLMGLTTVANVTPATGVVSMAAVAARLAGTGQCTVVRQNGAANNRLNGRGGASGFQLMSAVGAIFVVVTEGAWHSLVGVINGASSSLTSEGPSATGSVTGNTSLGTQGSAGVASTTCAQTELIVWDNYVLTAGETTALIGNQRSYWGF